MTDGTTTGLPAPPTRSGGLLWTTGVLLTASFALHFFQGQTSVQVFWIGFTVLMTLFCLCSGALLVGWPSTLAFLGIGCAFGLFFEALSIKIGFPFGYYEYTPVSAPVFGPGVLGVPYIIPLGWYVIVYLSYMIVNLMIEQRPLANAGVGLSIWLSLTGAAVVTAYDLALDPFMIHKVGAWKMAAEGSYFGEEAKGFLGWMLVAFTISLLFRLTHHRLKSHATRAVSTLAAVYPLAGYAGWCLIFVVAGDPPATRSIAAVAMGVPILTALAGLVKWWKATPA